MIMLRKAMRLVADVLQEPQRRGVAAQMQRLRRAWPIDLLLALGERDQTRRLAAEHLEYLPCRVELALAAVDQQDVGGDRPFLSRPGPEAPRDDFADRGEVVHALHAANAVAPIARFEGQAVDERHEGRDRAFAAEMGDIHAFDDARDATQPEDLAQAREPF